MDYISSIQEGEDPTGASPWENSPATSPRNTRTSFSALGTEPVPFGGFNNPQSPSNGGPLNQDPAAPEGFQRPGTATTASVTDGETDVSTTQDSQSQPFEGSSQQSAPPSQLEVQKEPQVATPGAAQAGEQQQARAQQQQQPRRPAQPQYRLQAKITGLERTGKKDPILRFDVHTNLPRFRTTQYRDVRRLHSEFVKLSEHLISANLEALVPAVPPPVTSAGAGTDEDETRVKALMQRWFNYVCSDEVLMKDDEMVLFVESDFGYSPLVKMKQPATGVRRKILKQFAPPPDDTPELVEARPAVKLFYLGSMDAGHKVDKLVKARRGLGLSESDYGVKLGSMHVQEPHPGLSNAYKKLGKAVQTMGDYHAAQATAEATTIGDPFQYHSRDAFVVKESLTNRQILMRELIQAQEATRTRLNAADRLRSSSSVRREKVDEAIAALDDAKQHENYLQGKTEAVTGSLVTETRRWFDRTAADMRLSIREFVLRQIEAERRTLALLENVRPDIRSIDASGGLSRLGREAHPPNVRRTTLAASQGPKGDAWSGVPRRSDAAQSRTSSSALIGKVGDETAETEEADTPQAAPHAGGRDDDDDDRVDARNAASRLATSTF